MRSKEESSSSGRLRMKRLHFIRSRASRWPINLTSTGPQELHHESHVCRRNGLLNLRRESRAMRKRKMPSKFGVDIDNSATGEKLERSGSKSAQLSSENNIGSDAYRYTAKQGQAREHLLI